VGAQITLEMPMKSARNRASTILALLAGPFAMLLAAGPARATEKVDVALVIATDVSYSVDEEEARFQRAGAIAAFRDPDVVKAIQSGAHGRIAVAYLDFSGYASNRGVVNWQIVHDKASADALADTLAGARRTYGVQTSISSGIELAMKLLDTSGFEATKRVIDVSGDGPNNEGRFVNAVRDEAIAKGIVINGLPIMTEADKFDIYYLDDLDKYYAGCVIGGPGSFIQIAKGFQDLARALRRKLILEISDARPVLPQTGFIKVAATTESHLRPKKQSIYEKGCDVGERMRYGAGPAPSAPAP
jgi:hypothetical protein